MKDKNIICPECQNKVSDFEENVLVGDVVECNHCGSELRIEKIEGDEVSVTVIEEEK